MTKVNIHPYTGIENAELHNGVPLPMPTCFHSKEYVASASCEAGKTQRAQTAAAKAKAADKKVKAAEREAKAAEREVKAAEKVSKAAEKAAEKATEKAEKAEKAAEKAEKAKKAAENPKVSRRTKAKPAKAATEGGDPEETSLPAAAAKRRARAIGAPREAIVRRYDARSTALRKNPDEHSLYLGGKGVDNDEKVLIVGEETSAEGQMFYQITHTASQCTGYIKANYLEIIGVTERRDQEHGGQGACPPAHKRPRRSLLYDGDSDGDSDDSDYIESYNDN